MLIGIIAALLAVIATAVLTGVLLLALSRLIQNEDFNGITVLEEEGDEAKGHLDL